MEVYILDDLLRRNTIIDRFESCIWTERYSAFGDFQLVIHSTNQSRSQLVEGTVLAVNNSKRVMQIENVENRDDSEGRSLLTVTGRSLEATMEDRVARGNLSGTSSTPQWVVAGDTPANIARYIVQVICVTGTLDPLDVIPMLGDTWSSLYPTNTIAEPDQVISYSIDPKDLYTALKELCDIFGLGFRLYRGPDNSILYFNVYTGDDRTSSQQTLPAVIFAPDLENLTNTSEFRSIEKFKNIALVIGKTRSKWVYATDAAMIATGMDRRVLTVLAGDIEFDEYVLTQVQIDVVNAAIAASTNSYHDDLLGRLLTHAAMTLAERDIIWANYVAAGPLTSQQKTDLASVCASYNAYWDLTVPYLDDVMEQRGQAELTKYKAMKAMDGELPINSGYRYGIDYELGDLVEMRNEDGLTNRMRVTEQIFVDDAQGERSYPTLAIDEFITPGTWYAWDANGVWDTAIGTWDDQPE